MDRERMQEVLEQLSTEDKVGLLQGISSYDGSVDDLHYFDDDFFNIFYENDPMGAARATFFGNIQNWADPYIRTNGSGNLESISEYQVDEIFNDDMSAILDFLEEHHDEFNYIPEIEAARADSDVDYEEEEETEE